MTYIPKPAVVHPGCSGTRSVSRAATTKGRSRRCAPAADTTRSPRRSSRRSGSCRFRRTAWPSSRASAARRRHPPTSSRRPTASTACTDACRRSSTGANAANSELIYIGVSGDGDSLSIGLGQLSHAIRRNVNLLYMLENNGVYGLTKGQFSASADRGSLSKKGEANTMESIDGCLLALTLGATFVARSFSGDKAQLVPIIKAGLAHSGFAFVDVISPCVTFNDHEGSTKSYAYTREHNVEIVHADFVPPADGDHDRVRAGRACAT